MEEKVLNNKKNGMPVMLLCILLYVADVVAFVFAVETVIIPLIVITSIWLCLGWIPLLGLRILKPQEALVLTLFGKYVGTIKEAGFYFVNPFCVAVNPAASTKLNQSGDVTGDGNKLDLASMAGVAGMAIAAGNVET